MAGYTPERSCHFYSEKQKYCCVDVGFKVSDVLGVQAELLHTMSECAVLPGAFLNLSPGQPEESLPTDLSRPRFTQGAARHSLHSSPGNKSVLQISDGPGQSTDLSQPMAMPATKAPIKPTRISLEAYGVGVHLGKRRLHHGQV